MAYLGTKPANQVIDSTLIADGTVTPADLSTGKPVWDTSGNVGIGTSTMGGKLNVTGSSANAVASYLQNSSNGTYSTLIAYGSNGDGVSGWANANLLESVSPNGGNLVLSSYSGATVFQTGSGRAERMRIDSSGNLLVNTTSQFGNGVLNINTYRGGAVTGIMTQPSTNANYDAAGFRNSSGSYVGYISCTASATSYVTSSDYRLKDNIAPMTGALDKVSLLKPCTYTWKLTGEESQGFIAHELAEVVPDCVTGEKDAVETYTDEDGAEQTRPKYQGIDTSFLVATLTAAIQEQQAIITSQADTISAMEARLTALEAK